MSLSVICFKGIPRVFVRILIDFLPGKYNELRIKLDSKQPLVLQDPSESVFWAGFKGLSTS